MKISCLHTRDRVSHRGRQKREHWVKQNFAEVSQRVINLSVVSLCRLQAEHKPITSRIKEVTNGTVILVNAGD